MTIRVLFVCLGNICRSPMAEAVFQQMVNEAGLADKIHVDSAGTGSWHVGESAHSGTLRTLQKHEIPYNGRARQIVVNDMETFDYVLAMDHSNLSNIRKYRDGKAQTQLFLQDALDRGLVTVDEVPDPYYTGNFNETYELVQNGSRALLDRIRTEHNL